MALTKVRADIIHSAPIGIHSGGTVVHSASTTLNFIGAGNTFSVDGGTTNISISGGGALSNDNIYAAWAEIPMSNLYGAQSNAR